MKWTFKIYIQGLILTLYYLNLILPEQLNFGKNAYEDYYVNLII